MTNLKTIKKQLSPLTALFKDNGKELYLVGGAIRDILSDKLPKDLDLTTNARPDEIKKILRTDKLPLINLGEKYGTIATLINGESIEITTFRKEKYNPKSRNPEVQFSDNLLDDLVRRDFKINAIAYDLINEKILDPLCGMKDLADNILETPANPEITFFDDPLRMLRTVRFVSKGFIPTLSVTNAIKQLSYRMYLCSKERITEEMTKILCCDGHYVPTILNYLKETGLLKILFPSLYQMCGIKQNPKFHHKDVWNHTILVVQKVAPIPTLRWAALFHDVGKPGTYFIDDTGVHFYEHEKVGEDIWYSISKQFKGLKKEFISDIAFLIRNHLRPSSICGLYPDKSPSNRSVRRLYFACQKQGEHIWDLLMDLSESDCTSGKRGVPELVRKQVKYLRNRPYDIISETEGMVTLPTGLGMELIRHWKKKPGPWIRKVQNILTQAIIDGDLKNNPTIEECMAHTM